MPLYRCPKCGRTVEKPEGTYYCKECGPDALMVKVEGGRQVLSVSGLCHTLTLEEYEVLEALDEYASVYGKDYANLWWIARKYQDRFVGRITPLLKSSIDRTRDILFELWRKGMVAPESVTVKTVRGRPRFYVPKTKKEAAKVSEKWRITIAGHDCIHPPKPVEECIKKAIEEELRRTGKVTPMKAFKECWRKYEK